MTEKEFFMAVSGRSENDDPKACIMIETSFYNLKTSQETEVNNINLYGPILNFSHRERDLIVDIKFDSPFNSNLLKLILQLNKLENSSMPDDSWSSQINLAVVPIPNKKKCHAEFIGARWDVISSEGAKFPDTVRFVFVDVNFQIYQLVN